MITYFKFMRCRLVCNCRCSFGSWRTLDSQKTHLTRSDGKQLLANATTSQSFHCWCKNVEYDIDHIYNLENYDA